MPMLKKFHLPNQHAFHFKKGASDSCGCAKHLGAVEAVETCSQQQIWSTYRHLIRHVEVSAASPGQALQLVKALQRVPG